jgi:hypothetical protein
MPRLTPSIKAFDLVLQGGSRETIPILRHPVTPVRRELTTQRQDWQQFCQSFRFSPLLNDLSLNLELHELLSLRLHTPYNDVAEAVFLLGTKVFLLF